MSSQRKGRRFRPEAQPRRVRQGEGEHAVHAKVWSAQVGAAFPGRSPRGRWQSLLSGVGRLPPAAQGPPSSTARELEHVG